MLASENDGFMKLADGTFSVRLAARSAFATWMTPPVACPEAVRKTIAAVRDAYGYLFVE